jgi:hypothetical protein
MTGYQAGWDSALVVTLQPGPYTAVIASADGTSDIGLVEIYEVL